MNVLAVMDKAIDGVNMRLSPEHAAWNLELRAARDAVVALVKEARMAASTLEGCAADLAADCGHRELLAALRPFGG